MFCMNCGKKLSDNEKFCANCGWPAGQDAGKINGDGAREAGFPSPDAPAMNPLPGGGDDGFGAAPQRVSPGTGGTSPKKKVAKVLIPVLVVAAAVAIVIFTGLSSRAVNFFRRTFSSPQSYFQDVMKKALQDEAKILANNYNNLIREPLNIGDKSISGQITVNLGDEGRELIETAGYPEDLGWLQQVTLALELSSKNDSLSGDAALHLGKNELISGNAIYDGKGGNVYLQIPILSDTYLGADPGYSSTEVKQMMAYLGALYEACPDKALVEKLFYKYYSLALSRINNVEKSEYTLKAGNISQNCTALRAVISTQTLKDMAKAVLEEMRGDKELKTMIEELYDMNMQSYQITSMAPTPSFATPGYDHEMWIDEALGAVDDIQMDDEFSINIYVDSEGEIIGAQTEVEEASIYCARAQKGDNVGYQLTGNSYGEKISLVGTGRQSGDKEDVDFELTTDASGGQTIRFQVKGMDRKAYREGNFKGTIILPLKEFDEVLGDAAPVLRKYDVALSVDWGEGEKKAGLSLLHNENEVASIQCAFKVGPGKDIRIPSDSETILVEGSADFEDWMDTVDTGRLITQLKQAEIPSEIISAIESALNRYL